MIQNKSLVVPSGSRVRSHQAVIRNKRTVQVSAFFNFGKTKAVEEPTVEEPKKKRVTQSALNALDFAAPRSKKDAELLYDAKYGARGEDGKMTREQYAALRRKVGGTAKDYWKDWIAVDVQEPTGVTTSTGEVPFLPILIAVLLAVLGTTAYISTI